MRTRNMRGQMHKDTRNKLLPIIGKHLQIYDFPWLSSFYKVKEKKESLDKEQIAALDTGYKL